MKVILAVLILSFSLLNPQALKNKPSREISVKTISDKEKRDLDDFIDKNYHDSLPGLEILVKHKDKTLYHTARGVYRFGTKIPLKKNRIFETGSVTKLFTAVATLNLIEEGKLSFDDPLSDFYPDFPNSEKINIGHLLSHTTGIPDYAIHFMEKNIEEHFDQGFSKENYFQDIDRKRVYNYLKEEYVVSQPGKHWEYSNGGYYFLGLIIEKVTGKSYFTHVKNSIIDPLNLNNTTFKDPKKARGKKYICGHYYMNDPSKDNAKPYPTYYLPNEYAFSAGALNSTLKDLYRFYKEVVNGKIINKDLLEEAMTPYELKNGERANTGYGWFIHKKNGKKVICHPGCTLGFSAITHFVPEDELFIGVYSNRNSQEFNLCSNNITLVNKVFSYFYN